MCIPSLMSFGTLTAACPMAAHYLHFSTSSHKVSSLSAIFPGLFGQEFMASGFLVRSLVDSEFLDDCLCYCNLWFFSSITNMSFYDDGTELKGATPDILQRLIPEHARKQNPMLAL